MSILVNFLCSEPQTDELQHVYTSCGFHKPQSRCPVLDKFILQLQVKRAKFRSMKFVDKITYKLITLVCLFRFGFCPDVILILSSNPPRDQATTEAIFSQNQDATEEAPALRLFEEEISSNYQLMYCSLYFIHGILLYIKLKYVLFS